ncbi:MAG: nucleoside recognition domain-containing protein [Eubacteriales bacterium]|nr:nucleoside recognition domain-containing protein [Eubacteriales bacterium]
MCIRDRNILWSIMIAGGIIFSFFNGTSVNLTDAVITSGKESVEIALTMCGIVPLWCGMLKIAEHSGMTAGLSKLMSPVINKLFPEIPKGHKSLEYITSNITANMLGLGWAATPSGIDAMKSLAELNKNKNTASKSMCMFMVINMSSVQLITINIIAYRTSYASSCPSAVILPGIIATAISTAAGILAVKLAERSVKNAGD